MEIMDEPTHIMVNGERVDLSPQQKAEYRQMWADGQAKINAQKLEQEAKAQKRAELLQRLGISEEEFQLLKVLA